MRRPANRPAESEYDRIMSRDAAAAAPLPLFMESAPHNGTISSREAAAAIVPSIHAQRAIVLAHLAACGAGGATAQEIEAALGMSGNSVRPRLCELAEHGAARRTGTYRNSASGRRCEVWRFIP